MKKLFVNGLALAIFTSGFISNSFSQDQAVAANNLSGADKLAIISNENSAGETAKTAYSVNSKVSRSFLKNFKETPNVSWRETKRDYVAEFKKDGRLILAWFNKSGELYCTNYYGSAIDLPAAEADLIKNYYRDYHITAVTEIVSKNIRAFVVTIQNCDVIKKIKIVDGEMVETEQLTRSK